MTKPNSYIMLHPVVHFFVTNNLLILMELANLSLLLLPLLLALLIINNKYKKPSPKLPPGPRRLPIIGNLHQIGSFPHHTLFKLSQEYGSLMYLKFGLMPTIVASSAATAKELLKDHDLDCCTRPSFTSPAKLTYNNLDIVSSPYGSLWRELRKICIIEFFSTKKVRKFQPIREEEVARMVNSIESQSSLSSNTVDLSVELFSLSNDITCRTALGKRYFNREESKLPEMVKESEAMLAGFFFADFIPQLGWLDAITGMRSRLEKNFQDLDDFYEKVIKEHLDPSVHREGGEDTIDALLRICKQEGSNLSKDHIKAVLMNIFVGGSDTSSSAIEWTMTELMRHPGIMEQAQNEVRTLVGDKGKVEETDLHRLSYMKCVIKESFRIHPPVPILVQRETMHHCKINGFDVPPKTRVIVNVFAIGREEGCWKDPEVFKPERFIDNEIDLKGHDFQLIPFGAGRRICPGMHIGMAVVELALANLLYCFDWKLPMGMSKEDVDLDEAISVTLHRKNPLRLVATKYYGKTD